MTERHKLELEIRQYYAEVGLILTEFLHEDGSTVIRGVLDRVCEHEPSTQLLVTHDTPLHTAFRISKIYTDYLWNPDHDSAIDDITCEYYRVHSTEEWAAKKADFERSHLNDYGPHADDELRIYIVIRRDIGDILSKAKFGVQCAHATLSVWGMCLQSNPMKAYAYLPCDTDKIKSGQAKIVLEVKNDVALLALADQARELGHPVATITDAARTELEQPTLTAIAIGPLWYKSEGKFLKRVQLYKDKPEKPSGSLIYTIEKGG